MTRPIIVKIKDDTKHHQLNIKNLQLIATDLEHGITSIINLDLGVVNTRHIPIYSLVTLRLTATKKTNGVIIVLNSERGIKLIDGQHYVARIKSKKLLLETYNNEIIDCPDISTKITLINNTRTIWYEFILIQYDIFHYAKSYYESQIEESNLKKFGILNTIPMVGQFPCGNIESHDWNTDKKMVLNVTPNKIIQLIGILPPGKNNSCASVINIHPFVVRPEESGKTFVVCFDPKHLKLLIVPDGEQYKFNSEQNSSEYSSSDDFLTSSDENIIDKKHYSDSDFEDDLYIKNILCEVKNRRNSNSRRLKNNCGKVDHFKQISNIPTSLEYLEDLDSEERRRSYCDVNKKSRKAKYNN